ncbi:11623_t:CDS:2, partial [Gigaspora margarita]
DIPLRTPPRIPSPAPTTASSSNPLTRFINFITSGQLNNPPSPHHTVYPIHPEETNPVPSVIVDINPPNKEPIRTLTPEAPLALTDPTNAINALAVALGQAMAYMKDNAQECASSLANAPNHFQNDNHSQNDHNAQLQAGAQPTQTFVTLQDRVRILENFHIQMKNLYTQSLVQENPDEPV